MTILSPQHMTIPTNTVFYSQLSYCFLLALHEHQICRSFSVFELYSTHCSHHGSLCSSYNSHLTFSQASCFTSIQYCRPYIALSLTAPFSFGGNLLPYRNSLHSLSLTYPHLVLAATAASHPPPALTLSPRYVSSPTVSTSSHSFFSCYTVSPIFTSLFVHAKFLLFFGVSLFTPAHLP